MATQLISLTECELELLQKMHKFNEYGKNTSFAEVVQRVLEYEPEKVAGYEEALEGLIDKKLVETAGDGESFITNLGKSRFHSAKSFNPFLFIKNLSDGYLMKMVKVIIEKLIPFKERAEEVFKEFESQVNSSYGPQALPG